VRIVALENLGAASVDMLTIVIVGNSTTRVIAGDSPRLYTPRGYRARSSFPRKREPRTPGVPSLAPGSGPGQALGPRLRGGDG